MADVFEVRAIARHVAISPQKVRLVVDEVRGLDAKEALDKLRFMPNRAAEPVFKLIQSAVANAEQNFGLEANDLYVSRIFADDGPRNRLRPYGGRFGGRGRFKPIINRSSHITVYLAEREAVYYD
ncbi:MAG TPA: 50S ribosomal protein L22 [Anaerolineae bacterium]|nr:50S ribosomal protein L22 [Anaerolineae bacterium]